MKTIKFYTLGCKVNQYDTQALREGFLAQGFKELENGQPADTYVVNTCTVTHKADTGSLGLIRRARKENARAKIIVTGCLTELDEAMIKAVDTKSIILKNREKAGGISGFKNHTRAFLKIQDGCDNFCSYCKVPLARGRSKSKPLKNIIQEAAGLTRNGFKEIVLTGICLGAYGRDLSPKTNLVRVIKELGRIDGLLRLRLSSIELSDISDELVEEMKHSPKLCRHLHIPLQSGDDGIIKKMKRNYSRNDYLKLIRKIKKALPGIAITTDVLVGFPGESEENFKNTLDLIKEIAPLKVHIFPYSPREHTRAFSLGDKVGTAVIKKRISSLEKVARSCSLNYKKKFLGKKLEVLMEGRIFQDGAWFWQGYTGNYLRVRVKSNTDLRNTLMPLTITPEVTTADTNFSLPGGSSML